MDDLIIFTHIQKTSGTSFFHKAVLPNIAEENILDGVSLRTFAQRLRPEHTFVTGHVAYGLHHLTRRKCRYITFLRDPIDRAVSHYYFIKGCDPRYCRHSREKIVATHSLAEYYSLYPFQNEMTKMLAGFGWQRFSSQFSSRTLDRIMLSRAKEHLVHRYVCFGLQEQFDRSIELFKSHLGWNTREETDRHKKTAKRPQVRDIDDRTMEILIDAHRLDIELYDFAKNLFDQRLQAIKRNHMIPEAA